MTHLTDEMRAQGWVEHDGGPCPFPELSRLTVLFRNGIIFTASPSFWSSGEYDWWQHQEPGRRETDIIAYRMEPSQ